LKTRFLGQTGLEVSELCLGVSNFGATGIYQQLGKVEQKEADLIVHTALDKGVNFFNTAERYSWGLSETIFGKALGARRKEAIVITKICTARKPGANDGGLSRKHIIEACEGSLKRLGTEYIDIYEPHEFDKYTPLEVTLRALDDLVRAGKVRYIGCSNFLGWQLMKSLSISERHGWERFMTLEAKYSLASRWIEYELVPLCLDQEVAILAWSPLHGGYLSGKYRRGQPLPEGTRFNDFNDKFWTVEPEKLFGIIAELEQIAGAHNATVSQAALNYVLRKPGIGSLIVGVRTVKQLEDNLKATDWEITQEEVAQLDKISQPPMTYPYYVWDPEAGIFVRV
jgi:aryl-alcohol dehydrogenase-like predicted oxidoreductase